MNDACMGGGFSPTLGGHSIEVFSRQESCLFYLVVLKQPRQNLICRLEHCLSDPLDAAMMLCMMSAGQATAAPNAPPAQRTVLIWHFSASSFHSRKPWRMSQPYPAKKGSP